MSDAPSTSTKTAVITTMGNAQSTSTAAQGEQAQKPAEQVIRPQEPSTSVQVRELSRVLEVATNLKPLVTVRSLSYLSAIFLVRQHIRRTHRTNTP